ncbi:MAG: type 4a pilus biogenesis protein PilO [Myxococcaceae bacterium]
MEQLLDRLMKLPAAAKIGGSVGLVALLTALNFFFLITPVEDELTKLSGELDKAQRTYAEKKEIADNLNERRREMAVLEERLAEALTELPERRDVEDLLAQLNDVGRKSGLEIAKVQPGEPRAAEFFEKIPIKMMVSGNYHEIAMFLQEVANLRRIVNISALLLTSPEVKNEKVILKSEFLATTFRFIEAKAKADSKKAAKKGKAE